MPDFTSADDLLRLCRERGWTLSTAMREREIELFDQDRHSVDNRMAATLAVMQDAVREGLHSRARGMGGLIGGEAALLNARVAESLSGRTVARAAAYALGVLEVNAAMGRIVAAPTAGASGVIPGVLFSLDEDNRFSGDRLRDALFAAAAVGYLFMRNATVSGARGGCQAEVGVASAMAAAAVELMDGAVGQCLDASSFAIVNILGLVCDPVCGLVEEPCQKRNALGASNALLAADMALAGIKSVVDLDGGIAAMMRVADALSEDLRETGRGGVAAVAGCGACSRCVSQAT
ncbi:MAG: L-serine ammonia-lyase, iron-sulfur-dependent, subunit alpha [Planctomycetaceae bacterium]|nr:L-serine ammonia-lyase, iron-sulfur-dependent, subunit alpha [Planctomycetaceae bacterium]